MSEINQLLGQKTENTSGADEKEKAKKGRT